VLNIILLFAIKLNKFLEEIFKIDTIIKKVVRNEKTKVILALSVAFQLGFAIAIPLVGFLWLGIYLDEKFKTSPWLFILAIILGLGFAFFQLRYFILPFLKKKQ